MRGLRAIGLPLALMTAAIVVQTTVFGTFRFFEVAPDLVMLVTILSALRLRDEAVLLMGFAGGLAMDSLAVGALGLRALVYTLVAYLALRTSQRADVGPISVALWAGALSGVGVVLLFLIGSIFNQTPLSVGVALRTVLLVPVVNFVLALVVAPVTSRLLRATPGGRR